MPSTGTTTLHRPPPPSPPIFYPPTPQGLPLPSRKLYLSTPATKTHDRAATDKDPVPSPTFGDIKITPNMCMLRLRPKCPALPHSSDCANRPYSPARVLCLHPFPCLHPGGTRGPFTCLLAQFAARSRYPSVPKQKLTFVQLAPTIRFVVSRDEHSTLALCHGGTHGNSRVVR